MATTIPQAGARTRDFANPPTIAAWLLTLVTSVGCGTLFPAPTTIASADANASNVDGVIAPDAFATDVLASDIDAEPSDAQPPDAQPTDADTTTCPQPCPAPTSPCDVSTCINSTCATKPAPENFPCDDDDPCTAFDRCVAGTCVGSGSPNWLNVYGNGSGGRLSALVPGPSATIQAAGSQLISSKSSYEGWVLRLDADGKVLHDGGLSDGTDSSIVALARLPQGDVVGAGYAQSTGRVVRFDDAGKVKWSVADTAQKGRFDAIAVTAQGHVIAAGTSSILTQLGDGWVHAYDEAGASLWLWSRHVAGKRVAVTAVAAQPAFTAAAGGVVALGYDRTLPPGGSGADLYEMWLIALDAAGKQSWLSPLTGKVTGSASGLVARSDGSFVALLDVDSSLKLFVSDGGGKVSLLKTLPGGSIDSASDLSLGPDLGLFVARDHAVQPGQLWQLDAAGDVVAARTLDMPPKMRARIFGLQWLGGRAVGVCGDVMLQVSKASSTSWRSFVRRVDLSEAAACGGDSCLGAGVCGSGHLPCVSGYCDGVVGCSEVAWSASVCGGG